MKKLTVLFLISLILLTGCQAKPEDTPVDIPVYIINYSPAVKSILPALYACAAEFPDAIFSPTEAYYSTSDSSDTLSINLGEPELLPVFSAPLAYDEIILVTNPKNPTTDWTDFNLINLINGRIDNWQYLGWAGEVVLWLPAQQDEVHYLFNQFFLDDNPISPSANLTSSYQEIINSITSIRKSIGIIPASFADGNITAHSLNIRIPLLALLDSEPDEVQHDFLLCLQGEIGQSEIDIFYETLP